MPRYSLAIVVCLFAAAPAHAESLLSRYGIVSTEESAKGNGAFAITLENKLLTTLKAEDVSLLRVTPNGTNEYVIIQK